jgi:hypothetical protein
MVPDVAKKGHSFKGAFAYYLHDKDADTAERIAWSETRNLATDDPEAAKRIMIATAKQADQLKAAAGVKASGRKSNAHVYAYSLAWHPDEAKGLDRAEMTRAADASLKALGADHLQAVIVCHQDQKHPHVHVILNRVDPQTGVMFAAQNDRLKLSTWAEAYEQSRGHIVTPQRGENNAKRAAGDFVRAAKAPETKRPSEAFKTAAAANPQNDNQVQQESAQAIRTRAADLAQRTAAQRAEHKQQWADLSASFKTDRNAIYRRADATIAADRAKLKEDYKPLWRDLFGRQRREARGFAAKDSTLLGALGHAARATIAARAERGVTDDKGFLREFFRNAVNKDARWKVLQTRHGAEQRGLGDQHKAAVAAAVKLAKANRDKELEQQRKDFAARRAALIEKQNAAQASTRNEWRNLTAAKKALAASSPARSATPAHFQNPSEIRAAYLGAVQPERTRSRSRGRTRVRERGDDPKPQG